VNPSWDHLDDFLQLDDFAVTAVIHLQAGGARTVVGLFDDPFLMAAAGGYERDQVKPTFQLKESDTVGMRRGDWLVVDGNTYDILTSPQGDGNGMSLLEMAKR
jgi:hypothetical protein